MSRILNRLPGIKISNARKIVDLRNYIIHVYDGISTEMLWSILIQHLPVLKDEIEKLIIPPP
jgi:uncharacterized protein with HEPN domain